MPENLKYKPRYYQATITLTAQGAPLTLPPGESNQDSVTIVNVPFVLRRISHQIIGGNGLGANPTQNPTQDGNYLITWRTDQHNYDSEPIGAIAGYGSLGDQPDTPSPVELAPKTTITVKAVNGITRDSSIKILVVFAGVEPIKPDSIQGQA
jgi:hypothetical protein